METNRAHSQHTATHATQENHPGPPLRPLVKGDVVQRGDVFIDGDKRFEMSKTGVLLGVYCLGQTIRKDNGGWHRPA